ncbi:hypothetical protein H2204_012770 [Knufia peltigerae]|uniref:Xylanolytic transcriptional activator regulatory domain-containing protein n=1 Tax=Knufia peltigerae TaxID=1002370 RepID=A0AA38XRT3_9EURO|nr:hypothetical protein H2204_012770 [Knufia peltigerae]
MASEGSQALHQHQFSIHDGRSGAAKRPPLAQWYKQPERCKYPFTQPALGVNRKNFDYVRKRLETTTNILTKLLPSESIDALEGLSSQQLVERVIATITSSEAEQSPNLPSSQQKRTGKRSVVSHETNVNVPAAVALAASQGSKEHQGQPENSPSESDGHHESADDNVSDTGDDVNAVSTTDSHASSYVGPSSTMQMFRTILRIAPDSLEKSAQYQSPPRSVPNSSSGSSSRHAPMPLTDRMTALIDAYFHWVHPTTAIIDEATFRETALSGHRTDPPWLCLLNTVLALGSLGCTKTESKEHMTYYNVAKSYLDLEALGHKSVEFLQALMLMAGWYCHYRNRPNLASALLGVAFRMAYALGVHKETPIPGQTDVSQELRRTIWWNLVVLDAAEAVTLGRNLDGSIFDSEVRHPGGMLQEPNRTYDKPLCLASLLGITIAFSRIMTETQARLATPTPLSFAELLGLDAHLVDWYEGLPGEFHGLAGGVPAFKHTFTGRTEPSISHAFVQPCVTIRWRYLILRITLYRPVLMEAVLRRTPYHQLTPDQRLCIRKCLTLAGELIESARSRTVETPNQYIAWPATWNLLQVCMVPLVCLYTFREDPETASAFHRGHGQFRAPAQAIDQVRQVREECHRQVQTTLNLMQEMQPWGIASDRMYELINMLYEARHQPLRVWNNDENSPLVVLPPTPVLRAASSSRRCGSGATGARIENNEQYCPRQENENIEAIAFQGSMNPPTGVSAEGAADMPMYNTIGWPNVTWESLFELPNDFQWPDPETTYDMG